MQTKQKAAIDHHDKYVKAKHEHMGLGSKAITTEPQDGADAEAEAQSRHCDK